jgi:hypothetical protein
MIIMIILDYSIHKSFLVRCFLQCFPFFGSAVGGWAQPPGTLRRDDALGLSTSRGAGRALGRLETPRWTKVRQVAGCGRSSTVSHAWFQASESLCIYKCIIKYAWYIYIYVCMYVQNSHTYIHTCAYIQTDRQTDRQTYIHTWCSVPAGPCTQLELLSSLSWFHSIEPLF